MADLKSLALQVTNPKTNESFDGVLKTKEELVILGDGTTLKDLREAIWNTLAAQANILLQHVNTQHLTEDDLAKLVSAVTYNEETGTLTVETYDGDSEDIASGLNQSVKSFSKYTAEADDTTYPEGHIILKLELVNGDIFGVDLTDFVNSNVTVDDTNYTASYTAEPDTLQGLIAAYTANITLTADPSSPATPTLLDGGVFDESDGKTSDTFSFVAENTSIGDISTAKAILFRRKVGETGYTGTKFTSDGNTTPKFTATVSYELGEWYECYVVIYDTVTDGVETAVYRTNQAMFVHNELRTVTE